MQEVFAICMKILPDKSRNTERIMLRCLLGSTAARRTGFGWSRAVSIVITFQHGRKQVLSHMAGSERSWVMFRTRRRSRAGGWKQGQEQVDFKSETGRF